MPEQPNFSLALPGMPYDGHAPEAFMLRADLIGHFRHYTESIDAPVRTGAEITRIAPAEGGGFTVATTPGSWRARNVVLATGGYQKPKIPALSAQLPSHLLQLHTDSCRNPGQLPDGAVLIVAPASPAARSPRNCSPSAATSTWRCPRARKHRAGTAARISSIG
ncbi:cation diffusion facilitator CzcD-associated flavoprotein CzcO [Arthrobacter sp. V4I6]|nr:cation diffusion facilitator CzcD-associated flavoprotein CzcO [Arthrobacter sp. V1I7]MDQ0851965.1 cation diffusion facilitator CzcD-associated flavoprotein CzcO [Arthrobacter sp. V4I6]